MRGAGFRMGPCELMDPIGHDVNYAVTDSVHAANYDDPRYVPSLMQKELIDAGLLGRKSGRGFYEYPQPERVAPAARPVQRALVEADRLRRTDGRTALRLAAEMRTCDIAVFDWQVGQAGGAFGKRRRRRRERVRRRRGYRVDLRSRLRAGAHR